MPEFTIRPDPSIWHEVAGHAAGEFVEARAEGLEGDDRATAVAMAEMALAAQSAAGDLTLLLQESESSLYAVATFSMYEDRAPVSSAREAVALVTDGTTGPWEPNVIPVSLGKVQGFRVSELFPDESPGAAGTDFTALRMTQSTYVVSVGGFMGTVALSPAPAPAAGVVLALIEPVISTWEVSA